MASARRAYSASRRPRSGGRGRPDGPSSEGSGGLSMLMCGAFLSLTRQARRQVGEGRSCRATRTGRVARDPQQRPRPQPASTHRHRPPHPTRHTPPARSPPGQPANHPRWPSSAARRPQPSSTTPLAPPPSRNLAAYQQPAHPHWRQDRPRHEPDQPAIRDAADEPRRMQRRPDTQGPHPPRSSGRRSGPASPVVGLRDLPQHRCQILRRRRATARRRARSGTQL